MKYKSILRKIIFTTAQHWCNGQGAGAQKIESVPPRCGLSVECARGGERIERGGKGSLMPTTLASGYIVL